MDAAIAMYAALQSQLDVSKKELKDVEKLLAEAEQQRAVNNDVNDDVNVEGGSNKRRKVSPPPEDTNNHAGGVTVKKEEDNDHAYDEDTDKEDEDGTKNQANKTVDNSNAASANNNTSSQANDMDGTAASTTNNQEALAAIGQSTSSNNVDQVIVEGCGNFHFDGTYTKIVGKMCNGAPVYGKEDYDYIYRDSTSMGPSNWFIGYWDGNVSSKYNKYYGSPNNADSMTPPTNGWAVLNEYGVSPAPKLRIVTANNDVNSEGAQMVNEISRTQLKTDLLSLLKKILDQKWSYCFRDPVDTDEVTDYLDVVKEEPMDLQTIEKRIHKGDWYKNKHMLYLDLMKMTNNCKLYNGEGSPYTEYAIRLEEYLSTIF